MILHLLGVLIIAFWISPLAVMMPIYKAWCWLRGAGEDETPRHH
jgi:hypothetical protein